MMQQRLSGLWDTDRGLSVFLGLLLVSLFVLPPLALTGITGRAVTDSMLALLLISGTAAIARRRWLVWLVSTATLVTLLVHAASWFMDVPGLQWWRMQTALLVLTLMTGIILVQVFRPGAVNRHRILGAVAAYLLLGLMWAQAYQLLSFARPDAFTGAFHSSADTAAWIYYSFVTLTTTGYGDIAPVDATVRSLAMLEALIGQLYPAILLARLVSLSLVEQQKGA